MSYRETIPREKGENGVKVGASLKQGRRKGEEPLEAGETEPFGLRGRNEVG